MKKFGLLGKSLLHSVSPFIHSKLFELSNTDAEYKLYELSKLCSDKVAHLKEELDGFNVTIPYKKQVIKFLSLIDSNAQQYQAVNTVLSHKDKLTGYNTDVYGFLASLKNLARDTFPSVLILGAGGSAQMAATELIKRESKVTVAVRQHLKGVAFAEFIKNKTNKNIDIVDINNIEGEYDLLINCTPVGMYPNIAQMPIPKRNVFQCGAIFDLIYNPKETQLLTVAKHANIPYVGGIDMLVYQAAKAQELWLNVEFKESDLLKIIKKANAYIKKHFYNRHNRYVFIGFMASGKTTLAQAFSQENKLDIIDLDKEIERKGRSSIPEIFQNKGEAYFRQLEKEQLNHFLQYKDIIISAGGGTPIYNKSILQQGAFIIYIDTPFEICYERLFAEGGRPIAAQMSRQELYELYKERSNIYNAIADVRVNGALRLQEQLSAIREWF